MVEAAVVSAVKPGGRLLVLRNGVYGDRIAAIAAAHRIDHDTVDADAVAHVPLEAVARRLEGGAYDVVAMVHHETTTGLVNPVVAVGRLARTHGARFVVDSVSGLGGEAFDFASSCADIVVSTANKCLQGLPGLSFALARLEMMETMRAYPARSVYLHLPLHAAEQDRRSTAFTPAVQIAYALDAALAELEAESVERRVARYARAAGIVREGCEAAGLRLLVPVELRSNTITSIRLPDGVPYGALHDALKQEGFVIYAGQGGLASTIFRVATMGHVAESEYRRFVAVLGTALAA
jgi:2-aminoethylphosphonate-pyruvate transaminase